MISEYRLILSLELLLSTNHKDIGTLYLLFGVWSGLVGSSISVIIRLDSSCSRFELGNDQVYNVVVTIHALIMIFLLVIPIALGSLGNWMIPRIALILAIDGASTHIYWINRPNNSLSSDRMLVLQPIGYLKIVSIAVFSLALFS